jgi:hypothetical protein
MWQYSFRIKIFEGKPEKMFSLPYCKAEEITQEITEMIVKDTL